MENNNSNKVVLGILLGSALGAAAICVAKAAQHRKPPLIKRVGKTIADVGEMLETCEFPGCAAMEKAEKSLPNGSKVVDGIIDFLDMGMKIWKQFKR